MRLAIDYLAILAIIWGYTPQAVPAVALPAEQIQRDHGCTFCPELSPPGCTLCVEANPLLVVDRTGAASGLVRLCNRGGAAKALQLSLSDFAALPPDGTPYPLSSIRTVAEATPAGKPIVEGTQPLAPGQCLPLAIEVANLWQAGLASADLLDGREKIATLKAIRHDVPFNVKVDAANPEQLDISFTRGEPSLIRLRNEDPMTYRFRWRFEVGSEVREGTDSVAPNGLVRLKVDLDSGTFSYPESGFLRSGTRSGMLVLDYEPDPSFRVLPLPQKRFPVTAHLSYFGETSQRILNYAMILLVLVIGIVISMLINHSLPTQRRRVAIKQRLTDLEGRLAGLDGIVDSRVLSLLRAEKKRLRDELRENWPVFPATEAALPNLEKRIDWLERRIGLTVRAGETLRGMEFAQNLSHFEAEDIRGFCLAVLAVVDKDAPPPNEIEGAEANLLRAEQIRSEARQKPTEVAASDIVKRAGKIRTRVFSDDFLARSPEHWSSEQWKPFAELLSGLRSDFPAETGYDPDRQEYVRNVAALHKAQLVLRFFDVVAASTGDEVLQQRKRRGADLLKALQPGPYESLTRAEDIVHEVEQNISREDLIREIGKGDGSVWIQVSPRHPLPYQLVHLCIRSREPGLDVAIAKKAIKCEWTVPGEPVQDTDWIAWYYVERKHWVRRLCLAVTGRFRNRVPERIQVEASLKTGTDAPRIEPAFIEPEETKSYDVSRAVMSLSTLVITVLLVGLGLLAGAQEKLQALDWMTGLAAILVLGFGANVLKNVLSRT